MEGCPTFFSQSETCLWISATRAASLVSFSKSAPTCSRRVWMSDSFVPQALRVPVLPRQQIAAVVGLQVVMSFSAFVTIRSTSSEWSREVPRW